VARESAAKAVDPAIVARFGMTKGMVVQEFFRDDDADEALRAALAEATGQDLVDEDYGDVTDAALVWFREGDDDLADLLMDVQTLLDDKGVVWLLTPKAGLPRHVEPRDVEEGASLAGLHATSTFVAAPEWTVTQLVEKGRHR